MKIPIAFTRFRPVRIPVHRTPVIYLPPGPRYRTIVFRGRGERSLIRCIRRMLGLPCPTTPSKVPTH